VFAFGGLVTAVMLTAVAVILQSDGLPQRLSPQLLKLDRACGLDPRIPGSMARTDIDAGNVALLGDQSAESSKRLFLLWGDSHARTVAEVLAKMALEYRTPGYGAWRFATAPILETWSRSDTPSRRAYNRAVMDFVRERGIEHVLLVAAWVHYVGGSSDDSGGTLITDTEGLELTLESSRAVFSDRLGETVKALREANAHVWIMRQVPWQPFKVRDALATCMMTGQVHLGLGVTAEEHRENLTWVNGVLDGLRGPGITVLDPSPYLFDDSGHAILIRNGYSMYCDDNHLSSFGTMHLRGLFAPVFEAMVRTGEQH
jgi:hypothetical protein